LFTGNANNVNKLKIDCLQVCLRKKYDEKDVFNICKQRKQLFNKSIKSKK